MCFFIFKCAASSSQHASTHYVRGLEQQGAELHANGADDDESEALIMSAGTATPEASTKVDVEMNPGRTEAVSVCRDSGGFA